MTQQYFSQAEFARILGIGPASLAYRLHSRGIKPDVRIGHSGHQACGYSESTIKKFRDSWKTRRGNRTHRSERSPKLDKTALLSLLEGTT